MRRDFIDIDNIPTNVATWGPWVEDPLGSKDLILCIPGNPGLLEYYFTFLETIHKKTKLPVWIVGHTGHEEPKDRSLRRKVPALKNNEASFDITAQIEYKVEFIRKYIPRDVHIYFVGHSIGTYMILQLLKREDINARVKNASMLFPTIYNLPGTPLGVFCNYIVKPIMPLVVFLSWLFSVLPRFIEWFLVYVFFFVTLIPREKITRNVQPTIDMIQPAVIRKIFHLGFNAIDTVQEIDSEVINKNKGKLKFYYGATDLWAPVSHCKRLVSECPNVDAQVCTKHFNHDFVLKYSEAIGEMVASWISNFRVNGKM